MESAERIRRDFAAAWGRFGMAWGVAPSTATVQGYMLLHGGPLTEADLREALGFSHRATLLALTECESWGLIEPAEPVRTGRRGPASKAWVQVGDHWRWFGQVAGARKERETDPLLPLLEECRRRARNVEPGDLAQRLESLMKFYNQFDRGIGVIVRAEPTVLAHLFGALGRLEDATVDRLLRALTSVPEDELAKAGATLAGMRPQLLRGFIGLASQRGIARLFQARR